MMIENHTCLWFKLSSKYHCLSAFLGHNHAKTQNYGPKVINRALTLIRFLFKMRTETTYLNKYKTYIKYITQTKNGGDGSKPIAFSPNNHENGMIILMGNENKYKQLVYNGIDKNMKKKENTEDGYNLSSPPTKQQQQPTSSYSIYQMLPEARPLHVKQPKQSSTFFQFIPDLITPNLKSTTTSTQREQDLIMENIPDDRNQGKHQIGSVMLDLFTKNNKRIYQSYEGLTLGVNNQSFATCRVKEREVLQPAEKVSEFDAQFIKFESKFESGNLAVASVNCEDQNQYFLAIQRDTNSKATSQWYYFSVQNYEHVGVKTFHVVNLIKNYSAYQNGMKPCIFSTLDEDGWKRGGFNIQYRKNSLIYRGQRNYYSFSFSYDFKKKNDKVYFAYAYPYTFSRLQSFLQQKQSLCPQSMINVRNMAKTFAGNFTQIVSITNSSTQNGSNERKEEEEKKKMILISARVHPGETNSSFVCEGLMQFLLGNSPQASILRHQYMIKIIPFLNPDGVIHGNYRTSSVGVDLNRRWKNADIEICPQIYQVKKFLSETDYKTALFIDLHGHSKKRSSFMYGCLNNENPYLSKQFPFVLSKKGYCFNYFNCNFSTPPSKEGTSRINIWKQFGVKFSYTMEMSFCGPSRSKIQFGVKDYLQIGQQLGKVISLYFCSRRQQSKDTMVPVGIQDLIEEFYDDKQLAGHGEEDSDGSESGEQEIQIQIVQKPVQQVKKEDAVKSKKSSMNRYLNECSFQLNGEQKQPTKVKSMVKIEEKQKSVSPCLREKKSMVPSRISIQKIELNKEGHFIAGNQRYIGFNRGNIKILSKKESSNLSVWRRQSGSKMSSRQAYRPYSHSKNMKNKECLDSLLNQYSSRSKQWSMGQHNLSLPSVVKKQQMRYRKFRNNETNLDISMDFNHTKRNQVVRNYSQNDGANMHMQISNNGEGQKSKKQISLNQKIQLISSATHRKMRQSHKNWSKG